MQRLPHGYTNDTRGDGRVVVKRYRGPDGDARRAAEQAALGRLLGRLPVPAVLAAPAGSLHLAQVSGAHGQDLIADGRAAGVLRSCGQMLRRIQAVDPAAVFARAAVPAGTVLVHGDYGPNNLLLDPRTLAVTAVLDWEWAHVGSPVEDLAWCEWIVRMHHPAEAGALEHLFDGYGSRPAWAVRHGAMLAKCRWMLGRLRPDDHPGAARWRGHIEATATWTE